MSTEGSLYGPLAFKCLALFRNTDLLATRPETTDDIPALQGQYDDGVFPLAYQATTAFFHVLGLVGGGLFNEDDQPTLNPWGKDSLAFLTQLGDAKLIPEEPTSPLIAQLFNQQQAALVISGPWFLGQISDNVNYVVEPLPTVSKTGQPAAPFLTVEGAFLSSRSQHPQQALALAQFLASDESALLRATKGRQSVATLSAYNDPRVQADPVLAAFRQQLNNSVPTPTLPAMSATWEPMARAIRRVSRGALGPEKALEQLKSTPDCDQAPTHAGQSTAYLLGALLSPAVGTVGRAAWRNREPWRDPSAIFMSPRCWQ